MTGWTDGELLSAISAGNVAAFGELYDRHAARLFALCRRMLPTSGDAEEVLQDAFLQVWRQASRFDPSRASVIAWLIVVTRSRALDRLRAARSSITHSGEHGMPEQPARERGPEDGVLEQERASHMRHQVDLLPAASRLPLELAFYEGLTHTEIAAALCQPLGTVKTRIRQALLKLRDGFHSDNEALPAREPSPFTLALSRYLAARRTTPPTRPSLEGLTALVVDDDPETLDLLKTVLESAGARVVTGASAAAALAHLRVVWPDVMLTDIRMPGMDGYSLAEKILAMARSSARALPVVAFTAHRASEDAGSFSCARFAAYLAKPSPPNRVVQTVAQVCGRAVA